MFVLGVCYSNGYGVEVNKPEAVRWWKQAAELGCVDAMYYLGVCYANGEGVIKDLSKAIELCRQAAGWGHRKAMRRFIEYRGIYRSNSTETQ
jgi:TPR repeat protein